MALQPQPPFPKSRGDTIRSTDWNDLVVEVQRLDNDKVNRTGDSITGSLSISNALAVGTTPDPEFSLRMQTSGADRAPLLALSTPNNEDFLSLFGGRRGSQLPFLAWKRGDLRVGTATAANGTGFTELLRVNSSASATARLEVDGRVRAGQLTVGAWPTNPTQYVFFGANTLDQTQAGNYALLQGTASDIGTTYLNSSQTLRLRINNSDKLVIQNNGNIDIVPTSNVSFGAQVRQMLNLWSTGYGIGVQSSTLYFRTNSQFAWHQDGAHDDDADDPGATFQQGGRTLMLLDSAGNLFIRGQLFTNNTTRLKTRLPIVIGPIDPIGGGVVLPSDRRLKENVAPLTGALDSLLQLRGVTFTWTEPDKHNGAAEMQIGLIAQEVEQVFPHWVSTNEEGYKQLAIRGFEALTVEALRTLSTENEQLRRQNGLLAQRLATVEAHLKLPSSPNGAHPDGVARL
jgi:hypothetical protein